MNPEVFFDQSYQQHSSSQFKNLRKTQVPLHKSDFKSCQMQAYSTRAKMLQQVQQQRKEPHRFGDNSEGGAKRNPFKRKSSIQSSEFFSPPISQISSHQNSSYSNTSEDLFSTGSSNLLKFSSVDMDDSNFWQQLIEQPKNKFSVKSKTPQKNRPHHQKSTKNLFLNMIKQFFCASSNNNYIS